MVKISSLIHGFLNDTQDFGTAMKISKITNAVDDQSRLNALHDQTFRKLISTLRIMEEKLEISRETICRILVEDLGKLEICARFVYHCLVKLQAF